MKNIETELEILIAKEGGYTDDPADSGGKTIWGITEFVARSFGYEGDMKNMTRDQAKEIYKTQYWLQPKFDKVFALSPKIAGELFDTGVNTGVGTASRMLQRALNALNNGATAYPDMTVDGSIGVMSLKALEVYLAHRGTIGETVLLRLLNSLQAVRYVEIAEARPKDERFVFGWISNRVEM